MKEEKENAKESVERKTRRGDAKECAGTRLDHLTIAG